jgi:hypothetical protein
MRITRNQILTAIRTEPHLEPGYFAYTFGMASYTDIATRKNCTVCAVGSIFRKYPPQRKGLTIDRLNKFAEKKVKHWTYNSMGLLGKRSADIQYLKNEGLWLSLLSCEFELLSNDFSRSSTVRRKLAKFVKENFPRSFSMGKCQVK